MCPHRSSFSTGPTLPTNDEFIFNLSTSLNEIVTPENSTNFVQEESQGESCGKDADEGDQLVRCYPLGQDVTLPQQNDS
jgi:hypothetical protein